VLPKNVTFSLLAEMSPAESNILLKSTANEQSCMAGDGALGPEAKLPAELARLLLSDAGGTQVSI